MASGQQYMRGVAVSPWAELGAIQDLGEIVGLAEKLRREQGASAFPTY
jgi:hypothetical protein